MNSDSTNFNRMNLDELICICKDEKQNNPAWEAFTKQLKKYLEVTATKLVWIHTLYEDDINDAVNETIARIIKVIDQLKPEFNWKSFVAKIFVHELYKHREYRSRETLRQESAGDILHLETEYTEENCILESIAGLDTYKEVHRAIGNLSEKQREVIRLRYLCDIPVKEIVEMLGVPPEVVSSRLWNAKLNLSKSLKRWYENMEQ